MNLDTTNFIRLVVEILGLIAIFFAGWRLLTIRKRHLFEVSTAMLKFLDGDRARHARRWLYTMIEDGLPSNTIDTWVKDKESKLRDRDMAELIMRKFDRLGLLVRMGVVPIDIVVQFYVTPIIKSWIVLSKYIEELRKERAQPGHMWEFENLATNIIKRRVQKRWRPWKGISVHENMHEYKLEIGGKRIDLLSRLKPCEKTDLKYRPREKLWYLGFWISVGYWLKSFLVRR